MQIGFPPARERRSELADAPRFVQIACTGQTHGGGVELFALDEDGIVWQYANGPEPYWYPKSHKARLEG